MSEALLDTEFLKHLYSNREREVYARITALTFQEEPTEIIEGKVTQGSINIDGNSSVRRSCNLTLIAQDININSYYWGIKTKFSLEVGLRNSVDSAYEDIIWFPQGIFVINGFNTAQVVNSYTINISGKDKMCLLNGDLGGSLTASTDFATEEFYDTTTQVTIYNKVLIETIVREGVHTFAQEPYHNIIINDLDETAVELLEYRGDMPIFLFRDINTDQFVNFTFNAAMNINSNDGSLTVGTIKTYDSRIRLDSDVPQSAATQVQIQNDGKIYTVAKVEFGQTVGYRLTDLTYAGELVGDIGSAFTSILDKIKNMLGEYEYFYNVYGQFVFQRKPVYIQQNWNGKVNEGEYAAPAAYISQNAYSFEGSDLITSFQNNPNIANLRNDFSVWGERETASGATVPIHYRYAIDKKPVAYKSIDSEIIYGLGGLSVDWREIIYQMALDYFKYHEDDDFLTRVGENNLAYYPTGYTGYEQYYTDLEGFWRQLYNDNYTWESTVTTDPALLNFWFDFLDADSELGQFSVPAIGDRTKAVTDKNIKAIYYREIPELIFTSEYQEGNPGYTTVYMQAGLEQMFKISGQGQSAQDKINELLYNHSYCIENITLQAVPIYHLQPNTRISVYDEKSGINGEYLINRISIPLQYNGIMSITATKAPARIL